MLIGVMSAYQRDLELKIYLETHRLKLVKQDSQVAGPDEIVVKNKDYQELVNDVQNLSQELKPLMAKTSAYKKKNKELETVITTMKEKRSEVDDELLQLADKLKEKIGNYFDIE